MISVITPVFNAEKSICHAITSVIIQGCGNFEHVIVDGGSTDGTLDHIRFFAERFHHIRFVSEKDHGQSDALNKGMGLARGDIIGILNADDYYEPGVFGRVEREFRTMQNPGLLVGNCNVIGEDGTIYVNKPDKMRLKDILSGKPFPVNPSAYFYHKSLHHAAGMYNVAENYAMDLDFLLRAIQHGEVRYINKTLGNFVFTPGTKTYDDMQNGTAFNRLKATLNRYRGDLDPLSRMEAAWTFKVLEIGRAGVYYLRVLGVDPKLLTDMVNH